MAKYRFLEGPICPLAVVVVVVARQERERAMVHPPGSQRCRVTASEHGHDLTQPAGR